MASFLAGAGIAGSAIGGIFGAQGAELSGQASSQSYLYQAGIANLNATLARQNAAWASAAGEQNAAIAGQQGRAQQGQIVASQAANGLSVDSGTNKDVQTSQNYLTQENEATIRSNAAEQAYGYRVQAAGDTAQASADTAASSYALQGASIGAASSFIGGATSVATKWSQATASGALSTPSSFTNIFGGGV